LVPLPRPASPAARQPRFGPMPRSGSPEHQQQGQAKGKFRACRGPAPPPAAVVAPARRPQRPSAAGCRSIRCGDFQQRKTWLSGWLRRRSSRQLRGEQAGLGSVGPAGWPAPRHHHGAQGPAASKTTRGFIREGAQGCWPAQSGLSTRSGEQEPQRAPRGARRPAAAAPRHICAFAGRRAKRVAAPLAGPKQAVLAWQLPAPSDRQGSASAQGGDRPHRQQKTASLQRASRATGPMVWWPDAADPSSCRPAAETRARNRLEAGRVLSRFSRASAYPAAGPADSWFCNSGIGPSPRTSSALGLHAHVGHTRRSRPALTWASAFAPLLPANGSSALTRKV